MESQLDKVLAGPVSNRDLMCFGKAFQRPEIRATIRNISGCAGEQGHGRQRASAGPRSCWQGSARVAVPLQGQPSELWLDDVQPSGRPGSRRPDAGGQLRVGAPPRVGVACCGFPSPACALDSDGIGN